MSASMADDDHVNVSGTLGRALRSIPELRVGLPLTLFLAMVAACGRITIPLLLRSAVDNGFTDDGVDIGVMTRLAVIGFVAAQVTTLSGATARYRLNVQAELALASLRRSVTDRILALSIAQHSSQRRGVLVARATGDVETLSQFFGWGALSWVLELTVMVVVGTVMLFVNWQLALIAMAVACPNVMFAVWMRRRLIPAHSAVREHVGQYLGGVSELVAAAPLVRAYGAQDTIGGRVLQSLQDRNRSAKRADLLGAILFISAEFFTVATMGAVVAVSLAWREGHGLTAGTVVGFLFLTRAFLEPMMDLTEVQDQTNRAAAGLSRILDLIDLPQDVAEPDHPTPLPSGPLGVQLRDVDYEYPPREDEPQTSEVFALRNISLTIAPGETIAFVGATGSGKSTLAKLIVRSADPTTGAVLVGGVPLDRVASTDLRTRVQLVPQEPFLFDDTIYANLLIANTALRAEDIDRLLAEVGLDDWIANLPLGSQTQVGERGSLLSAGERQLVALARARASDPDVLVLDEATSSVDAATEAQLAETMDALAAGRTTVVIAHRLTTVARADRVVVMEAGRIVEVGTPSELAEVTDGHYARLVAAWERATQAVP
jgi:ATP-binding cassette, subfamily B, bacterial